MAEGTLRVGAWELGLFLMRQAEDWMYTTGYAMAAEMEEPTLYQVRRRGQLGTLGKMALGRQRKGVDGDGG